MKRVNMTGVVAAVALLGIGGAFWAQAGPLNPPAGPVSSTGVTLTDIYDAVQGGGGGNAGSPLKWVMLVPSVQGDGIQLSGIPADAISIANVAVTSSNSFQFGGGGGGGLFVLDAFGVVVDSQTALPDLTMLLATATVLPEIKVQQYRLDSSPQMNYELVGEYVLGTAVFTGITTQESSGDIGTFKADLVMGRLCIKRAEIDQMGMIGQFRSVCWDFQTNSPCTCP